MKKKLLLMCLMIAVLTVLLAVAAFAEEIEVVKTESEEYGTVIRLSADPGLDNAKQYVSTLKKINDTGDSSQDYCILTDGTFYYVFPSSYITVERTDGKFEIYAGTEDQPGLAQAMEEFNVAMNTTYYDDYVMGGGTYGNRRLDAIVRFEFSSDVTFSHPDWCCMRSYPNLVEVRFNHPFGGIASGMFQKSAKLKTIIGFENVDGTSIGTSVFLGCSALEYIKLPLNTDKIPGSCFWGCKKLNIANISELTNLTTIGKSAFQDSMKINFVLPDSVTTIEESAFQSAVKEGGSFTINPTSQLTTIGVNAFRDCRTLPSIYIPSSVTSIGSSAFRQTHSLTELVNFENCQITEIATELFYESTSLKSIKLPETVTSIGANAFYKNEKLELVYLPKSITSIADTFTGTQPSNALYIYTGNDASDLSACARLAGANTIQFSDYSDSTTYTGINLVVGYSHCVAYYKGVHAETKITTIVSTYYEPIQKVRECTLCAVTENIGEISPIFTYDGYSTPEDESRLGIVLGFVIDNDAMLEYNTITGKTLEYGVFIAVQSKIGNNDIFDENGNNVDGVVSVDLTNSEFAMVELKITGFTNENKDVMLALGIYTAFNDGETTKYSYLQNGNPSEGYKYYFTSFSETVNV